MAENKQSDDNFFDQTKVQHWQRANEMNIAMQIAKSRERFRWSFGYASLLTIGSALHWAHKGSFPAFMLLPISATLVYAAWEWDTGN